MEKIIEVSGLKKSYGKVHAVRGIDFYVETGTLFAFLGPNGAGKSTTISMICTLAQMDEGSIRVAGYEMSRDDDAIRKEIGVVFQESLLDELLTVRENLEARGSLYDLKGDALKQAIRQAAEAAGVTEFLNRPYGQLSGGQRRRADIARALINTPAVLFLDEPTTGLDPQTRKSVWDTIRRLQAEKNMTVFLTTHYMEEAAGADYVAVIDQGVITAKGTPAQLREQYSRDHLVMTGNNEAILELLRQNGAECRYENGKVTVTLEKTLDALPLLKLCEPHLTIFEVVCGSMDDAFINITKGGFEQ